MENLKKYQDFDFKPLKNTQIAILRAIFFGGGMAYIFQKFSRRRHPKKYQNQNFIP